MADMKNTTHDLRPFFAPRSVAVFGSVKKGKIAHQVITQLITGGYTGEVWAVNPGAEAPEGFSAVRAVSSLEGIERVDCALISVPARFVKDVVASCGEAGIPSAVVFTSGFSETGNRELEAEVAATARQGGVRMVGPNCAGVMNTATPFYGSIEIKALQGHAALISQSGAIGGAVIALGVERGIGFSTFVSYGNRGDVDETDLLPWLADDPETRVIGLYLESMQDGREFMKALKETIRKKPVVLLKAGKSTAGQRAAGSHTGALAGSDDVFEAVVRQTGAIRAKDTDHFLDLLQGFSTLSMAGNRVAIVTNSGGPGILTTDRAEEAGLSVAETPGECQQQLSSFLPEQCALSNPVDLTVEGTRDGYSKSVRAVLDTDFDGAIVINVATPFLDSRAIAEGIIEGKNSAGASKPVAAVFMAGEMVAEGTELLQQNGIPVFPSGERAASVLAELFRYHHFIRTRTEQVSVSEQSRVEAPAAQVPDILVSALSGDAPLLEPDLVRFLSDEGLPFPKHAFITAPEELEKGAAETGFPAVMKVVSPEILHKSDVGGVALGIKNMEMLITSFSDMQSRFADSGFRGVMLYSQVSAEMEIIGGIKKDRDFGPVVLAGAGGVLTELHRDTSLAVAPINREETAEMLSQLRISPLFSGYRGSPPINREKLTDIFSTLSELAVKFPFIMEMDLNPLFLTRDEIIVGDVRLILDTLPNHK